MNDLLVLLAFILALYFLLDILPRYRAYLKREKDEDE